MWQPEQLTSMLLYMIALVRGRIGIWCFLSLMEVKEKETEGGERVRLSVIVTDGAV